MPVSLFPYDKPRPIQDVLISEINKAVNNNSQLIAHAPTGLGKTSASLAAMLSNTLDTGKTVVFLTSMHTQHKLALDTIRDIRNKHNVKVVGIDVIGKKHLCLQPGVTNLGASEFIDYCKTLRNEGKCKFYNNLKKGDEYSKNTKDAVNEFKKTSPVQTEDALKISEKYQVCPYETGLIVGKEAHVIVTDYYYLFNPKIRDTFLAKIGKELEDLVLIVDEAHNLPSRIKDLSSHNMSNITLNRAISEAEELNQDKLASVLREINEILDYYSANIEKESYMRMEEFRDRVSILYPYDDLIELLEENAEEIREEQKTSYLGSVANFLDAWQKEEEGFARIFSKKQGLRSEIKNVGYKCLHPGVITSEVFERAASSVVMSGTLTPTSMYKEVLGLDRAEELTLKSPFPDENRLNIVIPKTSTKYTHRNEAQYKEIAKIVTNIANQVPGNSAIFFPSYKLRDNVQLQMRGLEKTVLKETQGLNKTEREEILDKFRQYKEDGAVLLGVSSGSFAEGIDLPGDLLKAVVVVGLPLQVPDLETKAVIKYYDAKFGKGWDYGYLFPAFNKTLQSAGRCIRSDTDRGVVVFLDERYAWPNYSKCFPEDYNLRTTLLYTSLIKNFFEK